VEGYEVVEVETVEAIEKISNLKIKTNGSADG